MVVTTDQAQVALHAAGSYTPSPRDWRDHWIYFLMIDRFNNVGSAPPPHWNAPPATYQGGTFAGVQAQLDYIKRLGAGAIWLTPVIKNPVYLPKSYHGYGAQDFLAINPFFSSDVDRAKTDPTFVEGEFRSLVQACHDRSLYVIVDVVIRHAGDVFGYTQSPDAPPPWRAATYDVQWRDPASSGLNPAWPDIAEVSDPEAGVWPLEIRKNDAFVRRGYSADNDTPVSIECDFKDLKALVVNSNVKDQSAVQDVMILAYKYLIAKYDIDGLRLDSLGYVDRTFAQRFANAIREYALSIGKQNFFTFGEVTKSECEIANFVGRTAKDPDGFYGVDAALDFPVRATLVSTIKNMGSTPRDLCQIFADRHRAEDGIISSHGEASSFFVTFLDNHDDACRFGYLGELNPARFADQVKLGLATLLTLQGIPCIYYGTEQGLQGHSLDCCKNACGGLYVREALWGKPGNPFCVANSNGLPALLAALTDIRARQPALCYGRQYFRPTADAGSTSLTVSSVGGGPLAYSRILSDTEVLVVCNTCNDRTASAWTGDVLIDATLNPAGSQPLAWSTNKGAFSFPDTVKRRAPGEIWIDGSPTTGCTRTLRVTVNPMEAIIVRLTPDPGQPLVSGGPTI
jgi:glycosidase